MEFCPKSFWLDGARQTQTALSGSAKADVVVIGAGFTGLSAARHLSKEGLSVIVLEAGIIGEGASGRNCGQIGSEIGRNLVALQKDVGTEGASNVIGLLRGAIADLEDLIDAEGIDCDYVKEGNVFAGIHPSHEKFCMKAADVAEANGFPVERIPVGQAYRFGLPKAVVCGFHDKAGGRVNPAKLVRGMAHAIQSDGNVQIFEGTRVEKICEGKPIKIECDGGSVVADACVLATNGYTPNLGYLGKKVLPAFVSVGVTEPLNRKQEEKLGWEGVRGMYTAHHVIENIRFTHDNRLLVGTKKVRVGFGKKSPRPYSKRVFRALQGVLDERFPELDGIRLAKGWTGRIAITSDSVPIIGKLSSHKNIIYAAGYSGHGVAMASSAGRHITELYLGRRLGKASILNNRPIVTVPPEPIRVAGATTLFELLSRRDRTVDKRARELRQG